MIHSLAKFIRSISDVIVWLENSPDWLNHVLFYDVPSSR